MDEPIDESEGWIEELDISLRLCAARTGPPGNTLKACGKQGECLHCCAMYTSEHSKKCAKPAAVRAEFKELTQQGGSSPSLLEPPPQGGENLDFDTWKTYLHRQLNALYGTGAAFRKALSQIGSIRYSAAEGRAHVFAGTCNDLFCEVRDVPRGDGTTKRQYRLSYDAGNHQMCCAVLQTWGLQVVGNPRINPVGAGDLVEAWLVRD